MNASSRARAAVGPAGRGGSPGGSTPRPSDARCGPVSAAGVAIRASTGMASQARKKGVNTRYPFPDDPTTASGRTRQGPPIQVRATPSRPSAVLTASSRRAAYGVTSPVMCTRSAPASAATAGSTSAGAPCRTIKGIPSAASSEPSASRHARRNRSRTGDW